MNALTGAFKSMIINKAQEVLPHGEGQGGAATVITEGIMKVLQPDGTTITEYCQSSNDGSVPTLNNMTIDYAPNQQNPDCPPNQQNPNCPPNQQNPNCPPNQQNPNCPPGQQNPNVPQFQYDPNNQQNPSFPQNQQNPNCPQNQQNPNCPQQPQLVNALGEPIQQHNSASQYAAPPLPSQQTQGCQTFPIPVSLPQIQGMCPNSQQPQIIEVIEVIEQLPCGPNGQPILVGMCAPNLQGNFPMQQNPNQMPNQQCPQ